MKKCFFALLLFLVICLPALADVLIPRDFFRPTPRVTRTVEPSPLPAPSPIVADPSPSINVDDPGTDAIVEPSPSAVEPSVDSVKPSPDVVEPGSAPEPSPEPVSGNFVLTGAVVLMAASLGLWMAIRAHKEK